MSQLSSLSFYVQADEYRETDPGVWRIEVSWGCFSIWTAEIRAAEESEARALGMVEFAERLKSLLA